MSILSSVSKNLPLAFLASLSVGVASAAQASMKFEAKNHRVDVFSVSNPNVAFYSYSYMPYQEWMAKASGKVFPMDVAPVFSGMLKGNVRTPAPHGIDVAKYKDQAREFAEVVNKRNQGGRPSVDMNNKSPEARLKDAVENTHVVETVLSAIVDRPFSEMNINAESVAHMAEKVDIDHYHFQVPGTFVEDVLEKDHSVFNRLDPNRNYLLSVFDLRDYGCAVMKDGIRDYFSKEPVNDRLQNESIYVISQVDFNQPNDLAQVEKFFGRRPEAIVTQQSLYADHLVRAAKTIFAFYSEGGKTRVVLLSNIAMGSKFFVGTKGMIIRQYLLDGVSGMTTDAALAGKNVLDNLLSKATKDVSDKNTCDRGLALGLIKYSQGLFTEFVEFSKK